LEETKSGFSKRILEYLRRGEGTYPFMGQTIIKRGMGIKDFQKPIAQERDSHSNHKLGYGKSRIL
jgi:hypothetical protein